MRNAFTLGAALLFSAAANAQTNSYTVSSIVTNTQDASLVNPWGLSRVARSTLTENEWWTSDQVTGLSTLYDANGTIAGLAVTIPPAGTSGLGSPTGTASNPTNNDFAFVTLDGTLSLWNPANAPGTPGKACAKCHVTSATIMVNNSAAGASYQGVTIAKNATSGAYTYYVANANGGIEAYDATSFSPVTLTGTFKDPRIPNTYSPAGIQAIGSRIYVTYNAIAGGGTGYVDAYNTNGSLLLRLGQGSQTSFNQPWGVAMAPSNFGAFSSMLLVGNTGSGWIGAYSPSTGAFQGFLEDSTGADIAIPGLWGLVFGNGSTESGPTNVLYYNAGGANLTTGVFGAIAAN
jgi:uncharacterized protein (TIGR03118 family)